MKNLSLRLIAVALLVALGASGQNEKRNNRFFVFDDAASLSAADATVTVQQPSSGSRWVFFEVAQIYCSVACDVTISRDGTAATTTAATEVSLNGGVSAAATAFTSSNVGAGTAITTLQVAAGETIAVDLSGLFLEPNNSTGNNLTIDTDDITGDAQIYLRWREE